MKVVVMLKVEVIFLTIFAESSSMPKVMVILKVFLISHNFNEKIKLFKAVCIIQIYFLILRCRKHKYLLYFTFRCIHNFHYTATFSKNFFPVESYCMLKVVMKLFLFFMPKVVVMLNLVVKKIKK